MKIIYRIARLELARLFYSPIAWMLLIVFALQMGIKFTTQLEMLESMLQAGLFMNDLSSQIFSGTYRLWYYVQENVYFYIPLLTMGLLSKEISSGSIKLLYSSPVNFTQLVCGKFLAIVGYILLLAGILTITIVAGGQAVEQLDYGYVFTGLLGFFLLCCAYASIGLFISSLTSYQMVAAIGTLAILALLNMIGGFAQTVPVIKDIFYWLAINAKVNGFKNGLINSRDTIYLFALTLLFLSLTIVRLYAQKKGVKTLIKTSIYTGMAGSFILITYISARSTLMGYLDTTATKMRTLTLPSQKVASQMKDFSKVTNYINLFDPNAGRAQSARQTTFKQTLSNYIRFLPHIEQEFVYFYDSVPGSRILRTRANQGLSMEAVAKKVAKSFDLDFKEVLGPEAIHKRVDLSTENNHFVRAVEYKGKINFLRFYNDIQVYASENEITPALKTLITEGPVVGFLSGHGERRIYSLGDDGYDISTTATRRNREALISKGFAFQEVTLDTPGAHPVDVDILVVSDPKEPLSPVVMANLEAYIDRGGNLLLACEADSYPHLQPLMEKLGVRALPGSLEQTHEDFDPDFLLARVHRSTTKLHKDFNRVVVDARVSFPGAMALEYEAFGTFDATPVVVAPAVETLKDSLALEVPLPLMVALHRKHGEKEQRIVVSGDADFMSNLEYTRRNIPVRNNSLVKPLFGWMAYNEFPVDTSRPPLKDNQYTLSEAGLSRYRAFFNIGFPVLLLLAGSILLLLRKRK